MKRKYGWIPDLPDSRDMYYKAVAPKPKAIPDKVDLRQYCSTVEDQGYLGSCTANACAGNIEYLERKGIDPTDVPKLTWWQKILRFFGLYHPPLGTNLWNDTSRIYIYYNARAIEGTIEYDSGAYIRDCMKTLSREGHCLETLWPYDISKFTTRPSAAAYADGEKHVITVYMRITTLDEMLNCLADGYPFVFGITIYESFNTDAVRDSGIVNMPGPSERVLGGHAVMAVGYDKTAKRFIVRNSWGDWWGQKGYFTIPFEYLEQLGDDFWTIRKG